MNTTARISTAQRLGRFLGRGWRGYVRRERRAAAGLVAMGLPAAASTGLLWMAKLAVLGVLVYAAFWLALLLAVVVVVCNAALSDEPPEPEWRNGPAGFGLYSYDGFRIDPHVEDD